MSQKTIIRIALILAALLGLWAALGGPVPFLKIRALTPSDDVPTFEPADPEDADEEPSRHQDRDFVGDEYDPDRERRIDEMIEDAEERDKERMEDE